MDIMLFFVFRNGIQDRPPSYGAEPDPELVKWCDACNGRKRRHTCGRKLRLRAKAAAYVRRTPLVVEGKHSEGDHGGSATAAAEASTEPHKKKKRLTGNANGGVGNDSEIAAAAAPTEEPITM
jgi:hypothetical protein